MAALYHPPGFALCRELGARFPLDLLTSRPESRADCGADATTGTPPADPAWRRCHLQSPGHPASARCATQTAGRCSLQRLRCLLRCRALPAGHADESPQAGALPRTGLGWAGGTVPLRRVDRAAALAAQVARGLGARTHQPVDRRRPRLRLQPGRGPGAGRVPVTLTLGVSRLATRGRAPSIGSFEPALRKDRPE